MREIGLESGHHFWRNHHEEISINGPADCVCLEAGGVGSLKMAKESNDGQTIQDD
jgi:hypothetical protein